MMLACLAEAAFRTLLLACVLQLGLWLLRVRQERLLLAAWTVVLAASLAMPAVQRAIPLRLPVLPSAPTAELVELPAPWTRAVPPDAEPVIAGDAGQPGARWWLQAGYLLVAGGLLLRLGVGVALCLRVLGRAHPAPWAWRADAPIRISRDVTAPVTIAGVIVLPADAAAWSLAMRQAVIAHEGAHVSRRDFAMLLLSQVNRAVFWFSPLPWLLHRRLARLAELASDDHALQVVGDRIGYAEVLLEMGRRSSPLLRGVAMARQATLKVRLERILSGPARIDPVPRTTWAVLLMGAAGLATAAANTEPAAPSSVSALRVTGVPFAALTDRLAASPPVTQGPAAPVITPSPGGAAPPASSSVAPARAGSVTRTAARPRPRAALRDTPPTAARPRSAMRTPSTAQGSATRGSLDDGTGRRDPAISSDRPEHPRPIENAALRTMVPQTCAGAYLPGPIGPHAGGWLNLVRATFFRKSDGTQWLTFAYEQQSPVTLPVTVTDSQINFVGVRDTAFRVGKRDANHLSGTTEHPYGTVDLACDGPVAHLFRGAS